MAQNIVIDRPETRQRSTSSCLSGLENQIDALRQTGHQFHQRGWSLGTSSNYSVVLRQDPVELLITASGKDKGTLTPHDFVRVDEQGQPTFDNQPKSSAETMLHCVLAKRENVGAVLHTHSVWATLLSDLYFDQGGFVIGDFEMLKGLEGVKTHEHDEWVTIFDNTQDIRELSMELEMRLSDQPEKFQHGFLMRQHGLYTWGQTLEEARRHVEIFEFLFECVARKLTLQSSF